MAASDFDFRFFKEFLEAILKNQKVAIENQKKIKKDLDWVADSIKILNYNQQKLLENQIEIAKMYAKDHNFEIRDREELKNGQAED